jgi:predicted RNA-binding Zn ribbon-like protein
MTVVMARAAARRFEFIAGHPALDLLNTVEWRLDPAQREEDLEAYAHVLAWAEQAGLIAESEHRILTRLSQADPGGAEDELFTFRDLRETAYAALVEQDTGAADDLARRHREALDRARLTRTGDHWQWSEAEPSLTTPRDRATRAVVDLLTSPAVAALHQCEDAACGWVYLDTSPRRNRRWCVAADCGNRNRARRFYARQRAGRSPTTISGPKDQT